MRCAGLKAQTKTGPRTLRFSTGCGLWETNGAKLGGRVFVCGGGGGGGGSMEPSGRTPPPKKGSIDRTPKILPRLTPGPRR